LRIIETGSTTSRVATFIFFSALYLSSLSRPAAVAQKAGAPRLNVSNLERGVHDRINKERVNRKLNALGLDVQLSRIARAHSEDMARRHFFSHVNPDGDDPTARGRHAGYKCHSEFGRVIRDGLAENLFQGRTYKRVRINGGHKLYDWNTPDDLVGEAIRGWMTSPGHRRNILEKGYDRSGIGVSVFGNAVYITQLFC
jgi:uncharacterized protein YkwD